MAATNKTATLEWLVAQQEVMQGLLLELSEFIKVEAGEVALLQTEQQSPGMLAVQLGLRYAVAMEQLAEMVQRRVATIEQQLEVLRAHEQSAEEAGPGAGV